MPRANAKRILPGSSGAAAAVGIFPPRESMLGDDFGWQMSIWDAAARLGVALACAAAIGWEREWHGRVAGLRTHMLVALGSAGFTLAGVAFVLADRSAGGVAGDPVRIISAV